MQPFFSIIIPTRGRAHLLRYAIQSVLRQTFTDFEIIIADNNTDEESHKIVKEFTDPRISYFKTGGLSMPDNWEFGFEKTKGSYITILSDRLAYTTKFVLEKIARATRYDSGIVSWKWALCDDVSFEITGIQGGGEIKKIPAENIIKGFLQGNWNKVAYLFPKGLNSCISRPLYLRLKEKYGRICFSMSPDYTMAFLQLLNTREIVHIDECLFLSGGNNISNGNAARIDAEAQRKYLRDTGADEEDFYRFTPVKVITTRNSIFNDFFKMVGLTKSPLSWNDVDMKAYLLIVYDEIMLLKQADERIARIVKWREALALQPAETRNEVEYRIKKEENRKQPGLLEKISSFFTPKAHKAIPPFPRKNFSNIIASIENYESEIESGRENAESPMT